MNHALTQEVEQRRVYAFSASEPQQRCWQRLLGINVLNFYRLLEQVGDYETLRWLEDIQRDDYVVEVSSLPCPHRDRDRIGRVLSISPGALVLESDYGQRIKWENGKFLKIPEAVLY